jgi:hypothetical protein
VPGYEVKFQQVAVCGGADMEIRSLLVRKQYADPLGEAATKPFPSLGDGKSPKNQHGKTRSRHWCERVELSRRDRVPRG